MERVAGSVPLTREMGRFYRFVDGGKAVDRVDRDAWPVFHPVRIETWWAIETDDKRDELVRFLI